MNVHQHYFETETTNSRYWIVYGIADDHTMLAGKPFVALPEFGTAASMEWRYDVHYSYVASKLGIPDPDAKVIATFFNELAKVREAGGE